MRMFVAVAVLLSMGACRSAWEPAAGPYENEGLGIAIEIPEGWSRVAAAPRGSIILTKNGVALDTITVARFDVDQKLPNTSRRFEAGMSPDAAAETDISNRQFAPGVVGFKLLGRGTATVDGHDCYQYSYLYLESSGRPRKVKNYGCLIDTTRYRFHYTAPAQKWFADSLPTFEELIASVRFTGGS